MAGKALTRGARALALALSERGSQLRLTETMKCSEGLVSRWARGERIPTIRYAMQIEDALGIPARWWSEMPTADDTGELPALGPNGTVPIMKAAEPVPPASASTPRPSEPPPLGRTGTGG